MMAKKTVCVTSQIDQDLADRLKKVAAKAECSMSVIIREALLQYFGMWTPSYQAGRLDAVLAETDPAKLKTLVERGLVSKGEFTKLQAAVASLEAGFRALHGKSAKDAVDEPVPERGETVRKR